MKGNQRRSLPLADDDAVGEDGAVAESVEDGEERVEDGEERGEDGENGEERGDNALFRNKAN